MMRCLRAAIISHRQQYVTRILWAFIITVVLLLWLNIIRNFSDADRHQTTLFHVVLPDNSGAHEQLQVLYNHPNRTPWGNRSQRTVSKVSTFIEEDKGKEWERIGRFQFKILPAVENISFLKPTGSDVITLVPDVDTSFRSNVCTSGTVPFLLCMIPSLPKDGARRAAIRKTWGSAAKTKLWAGKLLRHRVVLLFLFATESYPPHDMDDVIRHESRLYGDVIAGRLTDSYSNLTRKLLTGMQWTVTNCPGLRFLAKVDQDTFLNLDLLLDMLDTVLAANRSSFVLGYNHLATRPPVMRHSRWAVSEDVYPLPFFPRYLYGHSYVISADILSSILHTARRLPYFLPEDAFFTGVLPILLNVAQIHSQRFAATLRTMYMCDVLSERFLSVTPISVRMMARIWDVFIAGSCDPLEAIKQSNYHFAMNV